MILLVHLLFGAAIGSVVKNIPLAIVLAFFSHYFWDLFPHIEYSIDGTAEKQWQRRLRIIPKIILDFCVGILLVSIFSNPSTDSGRVIIYICALSAILPDGLIVLNNHWPNRVLEFHNKLHQKTHFLKQRKISNFWRIASQVAVVIISTILLKI